MLLIIATNGIMVGLCLRKNINIWMYMVKSDVLIHESLELGPYVNY